MGKQAPFWMFDLKLKRLQLSVAVGSVHFTMAQFVSVFTMVSDGQPVMVGGIESFKQRFLGTTVTRKAQKAPLPA